MADDWMSRALAYAIYGGADFGECTTTAGRVAIGDADSWYREWNETADRVFAIGEASEAKGYKDQRARSLPARLKLLPDLLPVLLRRAGGLAARPSVRQRDRHVSQGRRAL